MKEAGTARFRAGIMLFGFVALALAPACTVSVNPDAMGKGMGAGFTATTLPAGKPHPELRAEPDAWVLVENPRHQPDDVHELRDPRWVWARRDRLPVTVNRVMGGERLILAPEDIQKQYAGDKGPPSLAVDLPGVTLPPSVTVNGQSLLLNGPGTREISSFDAYAGSLYTTKPVSTAEELFQEPGDKLLRLDILRDKVEKERIMGAFEEGFSNNAPDIARSPDARKFLTLFKADFYKGDKVDLFLGGDGTVAASQNGKALGTVKSSPLVRGILRAWFGEKPADEKLKKQTLGN